ncbi:MAG TPA: hypothetical protein VFY29_09980 [Terriglobia bacterium]|nr:hypothetical protein [Terriglobia bacterium]
MSRSQLRQIIFLLIFAFLIVAAVQYGSVYLMALEYNDYVEQQVKYAGRARRSMDDIRGNVVSKAREFGFDIPPRDVHMTRKGVSFTLDLTYVRPVEMYLYRHNLKFNVSSSGEMFQ